MAEWRAWQLFLGPRPAPRRPGDEEAARKDFDAAIEIFEKLESRLELARALMVRAGVVSEPDEDIRKARELFEACGAVGDLARL